MDEAIAHLMDFSKPFDAKLLDLIVGITMDGGHAKRADANAFLMKLQEHPEMWRRADEMIEKSENISSKIFGLQVLADMIETRWKVTPLEQREGIKVFIIGKIVGVVSDTNSKTKHVNHALLAKLNSTLIRIVHQDWPQHWPSFISEIVDSSGTSEQMCENNMEILRLLSEDIFEYSKGTMTTTRAKTLKESLTDEFSKIFGLCEAVLSSGSQSVPLIRGTLTTLQRFLTWIPLHYIFENNLITGLITNFLPNPNFRNVTLECLTEIASLPQNEIPPKYHPKIHEFFHVFLNTLGNIIPLDFNLALNYERSSESDQLFVMRLAIFLGTFLKSNEAIIPSEMFQHVQTSLKYLIMFSAVQDEELFKACLEYWSHFSRVMYEKYFITPNSNTMHQANLHQPNLQQPSLHPPIILYDDIIHDLRIVIIDHMAKPEEVLIVEEDNEIVRETTKDTEVIAQYKTMKDALVYLTNLNNEDTQLIMLNKLERQVSYHEFTWNGLNTLCWAIGSISGAMSETDEKRFLVSVIKDLLRLCEDVRGKDNKAVVASNIMYIVGQYPRFLRAHWKFLKTVVNKLFEFMHESHPGVQDMSCDTFLKISQKCKRKFMTPQIEDETPFILTLIRDLPKHVNDLLPHQVQSFYESVATMLSDSGASIQLNRAEVLMALMETQNAIWGQRLQEGVNNIEVLLNPEVAQELQRFLKINARVCSAAGSIYVHQLSRIFTDALQLYQLYSTTIIEAQAKQGDIIMNLFQYKALRAVKGEFLHLMTAFFEVCHDLDGGPAACLPVFFPDLMNKVLPDYRNSPPCARDAKVLSMLATSIQVFKEYLNERMPIILESVFQPTLALITSNFLDYPDHRVAFFKFLRNANEFCFVGLFSVSFPVQELIINSIVWAMKHTERNVSESGLDILFQLLKQVSGNQDSINNFYPKFIITITHEILSILTDRLHKSGFKVQTLILQNIFATIPSVQVPIFTSGNFPTNAHYFRSHAIELLTSGFPNVANSQIVHFVEGLFNENILNNELVFKDHVRDFLITTKEFSVEDNSDLYLEEKEAEAAQERQQARQYRSSVRGLLNPDEVEEHVSYEEDNSDI